MLETHLWSCENSFYTSKCWQWPDNRKLSMNTLPSFTLTMGFPTCPHCAGLRGDSICTDTELATVKIEKVEIQAHDSMCTAGTRQWIPMRVFWLDHVVIYAVPYGLTNRYSLISVTSCAFSHHSFSPVQKYMWSSHALDRTAKSWKTKQSSV